MDQTIKIEVENNKIILFEEETGRRFTEDEARNHVALMFLGEEIVWRSEHQAWEIVFDQSPFVGGLSFGPGVSDPQIALNAPLVAGHDNGASPMLKPELTVEIPNDIGSDFKYTIRVIPNGSTQPPISLDPRIRMFRRGRRIGE